MKKILFILLFLIFPIQTVFADNSTTVILSFPDSKFKVNISSDIDCSFTVNGSSIINYPDSMIVELGENDQLIIKVNCKGGTRIKNIDYSSHWNADIKVEDDTIYINNISNNFDFKLPIECVEHKYAEWIVTKEPLSNSEGSKFRECKVCKTKYIETIPSLDDRLNCDFSKTVALNDDLEIKEVTVETSRDNILINTTIFSSEEKEAIISGAMSARVELSIDPIDPKCIPMDIYDEIVDILESNSSDNYEFISVELYKSIENEKTQITNTGSNIKISISLPENFINHDSQINRNYYIIRVHDGELDLLNCNYNDSTNSISFETDRFSEYVISYKDSVKTESDNFINQNLSENNNLDNNPTKPLNSEVISNDQKQDENSSDIFESDISFENKIDENNTNTYEETVNSCQHRCLWFWILLILLLIATYIYRKIKNKK